MERWRCNQCGEIFLSPQEKCPYCGGTVGRERVPDRYDPLTAQEIFTDPERWKEFIKNIKTVYICIFNVKFLHRDENGKWGPLVKWDDEQIREFVFMLDELNAFDSFEVLGDTLHIRKDW